MSSLHQWRAIVQYRLTDEEARQMVQGYGHPEVDDAPIGLLAAGQQPAVGDPRVFLGTHNMIREETFICCFACEAAWTPALAAEPCPGEPGGQLAYVDPSGQAIPETRESATRGNLGAQIQPVGRNDPCPCGSGQKFKRCHGA